MKGVILAAALALWALPSPAQIHKWVDADGKVHFSDKPPPDSARKSEQVKIPVQSFGGPPVFERQPAVAKGAKADPAAAHAPLVMYATSWCGYCRKARAHLASKGIAYREVDIEASPANNQEFKAYGGRGVPFFVKGGRTMRGFSAEGLDRFLAQR